MDVFVNSGATVLANACGPCCGMWSRDSKEENSIVSSYNRNFAKRNDGNAGTHNFLTNPELATAMAFSGKLDFNPEIDSIGDFQFQSPTGDSLPKKFSSCENIYVPPNCDGSNVSLVVKEHSSRLQLLEAFEEWDAEDKLTATVLIKTRGKCTTDHISAAGPWLKFRGHLLNISQNTLIGAVNDANGERNKVWNIIAEEYGTIPDTAAFLRDQGMKWVIVGDENYGEGSSRELAALQPRFLGCSAVLARSFARIHETNLKKQGILPLTFIDASIYDQLQSCDSVQILGLQKLKPQENVFCKATKTSGEIIEFNDEQIKWFQNGSALNYMRKTLSHS